MTDQKTPSRVIERFHVALQRLSDQKPIAQETHPTESGPENKVPKRRLVKLPPSSHFLFPDLELD